MMMKWRGALEKKQGLGRNASLLQFLFFLLSSFLLVLSTSPLLRREVGLNGYTDHRVKQHAGSVGAEQDESRRDRTDTDGTVHTVRSF